MVSFAPGVRARKMNFLVERFCERSKEILKIEEKLC
jgi:hypothetical protein